MKITINGKEEEFQEEQITILEYLERKQINPQMVAIEMNRDILEKTKYSETLMKDGDRIEIVKYVGGGA